MLFWLRERMRVYIGPILVADSLGFYRIFCKFARSQKK